MFAKDARWSLLAGLILTLAVPSHASSRAPGVETTPHRVEVAFQTQELPPLPSFLQQDLDAYARHLSEKYRELGRDLDAWTRAVRAELDSPHGRLILERTKFYLENFRGTPAAAVLLAVEIVFIPAVAHAPAPAPVPEPPRTAPMSRPGTHGTARESEPLADLLSQTRTAQHDEPVTPAEPPTPEPSPEPPRTTPEAPHPPVLIQGEIPAASAPSPPPEPRERHIDRGGERGDTRPHTGLDRELQREIGLRDGSEVG